MTAKMKLYVSLLALGLVLIGSGFGLMQGAAAKVSIPEGNPVIYERLDYIMRGEFNYLYIYEDGSVIYVEEKGLRIRSPGHPPTRTWKTGHLRERELEQLTGLFQSSQFAGLDKYYQFPGKPMEPIEGAPTSGFTMGDGSFTFSINYEDLQKTVTAFGYLTPDRGETYPDMPPPLGELYVRLRDIALRTEEVARENIS